MKLPKVEIKTDYWQEKDPKVWQFRQEKMFWMLGVFGLVNLFIGVARDSKVLIIINALPLITAILAQVSFNFFNKEEENGERNTKEKGNNGNSKEKNPIITTSA